MKTVKQIQLETAKEFQCNPAQYAPFILRMRKEVIDEIKRMRDAGCICEQKSFGDSIKIRMMCHDDVLKISILTEMFEITDEELR